MERTPKPDILEYANRYHIDTVVVIWKAEHSDEADRVREYLDSAIGKSIEEVDCALYYRANFGPLSGMAFFAFGDEGCTEDDGIIIDDYAAGIPCETEMWYGAGEDMHQSRALNLPNWGEVA